TGLPVFLVEGLLSNEESEAIQTAAMSEGLSRSLTANDKQFMTKRRALKLFKEMDANRDGLLDEHELSEFVREAADMVDLNYTAFLEDQLNLPDAAKAAAAGRKVRKQEVKAVNWPAFFSSCVSEHPEWFARHSSQAWLRYSDHRFLRGILDKVAAVTGLEPAWVRSIAEDMQVLNYAPGGGHYSCHHDTGIEALDAARFMTVFFFLNDVPDGGETVMFGTDLNASRSKEYFLADEDVWGEVEAQCQSVRSCPQQPGAKPPPPFSTALVLRPRRGSAIFWYNMEVDAEGGLQRFFWQSIHGGCPTRRTEKWAANIWLRVRSMRDEL
ncbi:P4htm, partial [Symbiodinium pilosum]